MKNLKSAILTLALFASVNTKSFAEVPQYQIEKNHTSVVWFANHFGYSDSSGKFTDIDGTITFDEKSPTSSVVDVTIKIASLSTGLPKFEQHLKTADFFNIEKYETAKFVSKKVVVTGKNKAKVHGELTLVGVTKPVVLDVKFNKIGTSPITQKETIGFSATGEITRSEFGINYGIPGVSDKVKLVIEAEANR
jgi:polyisoprenoid-binding protein YceI